MGRAVIDVSHPPNCRTPEVEEKERGLNRCRSLVGLESGRDGDTAVDR